MRFIDLRRVAKALGIQMASNDLGGLNVLVKRLKGMNPIEPISFEGLNYTVVEIIEVCARIQHNNELIFQDWISSDPVFYPLLTEDKIISRIPSEKRFKGHFLEEAFYGYLSAYLFPVLQKKLPDLMDAQRFEDVAFIMKMTHYLTASDRLIMHRQLSGLIAHFLKNKSKEIASIVQSDELLRSLQFIRKNGFIDAINELDKSFYSTRIEFVKWVNDAIQHPQCDVLVLRSIRLSLLELALNPAQHEELNGFLDQAFLSRKSAIGKVAIRKDLVKSRFLWASLAFLGVIVFLLVYLGGPELKKDIPRLNSGLDSLNAEQINNVDTLLGLNLTDPDVILEEDVDDVQPDLRFSFPSQAFKNEAVKALHGSMVTDYNQQQDLMLDTECNPIPMGEFKSFVYEGMSSTDGISGPYHQFKNFSSYNVFVVVYENETDGAYFGKLIPSGGKVNIGLKTDHSVFFYIGKELTKFNAAKLENKGYGSIEEAKKVGKYFNAHFCEVEYTTLITLNKIFTVKNNTGTGGTTVLKGDYYDGFSVESAVLIN